MIDILKRKEKDNATIIRASGAIDIRIQQEAIEAKKRLNDCVNSACS